MSAASAHHLASRSLHPWELIAASSVAGEARDRRRSWTPPRQRDARDPVWEGCGGLAPTFDDRWGRQQAGASHAVYARSPCSRPRLHPVAGRRRLIGNTNTPVLAQQADAEPARDALRGAAVACTRHINVRHGAG